MITTLGACVMLLSGYVFWRCLKGAPLLKDRADCKDRT